MFGVRGFGVGSCKRRGIWGDWGDLKYKRLEHRNMEGWKVNKDCLFK